MDSEFNVKESLRVIDQMIDRAKFRPSREDSLITMLWGYLVLFAALLHWALQELADSPYAPAAWLLMVPGIIATVVLSIKARKKKRVKSYVDDLVGQVWTAFSVAFILLFFFMSANDAHFLPVVLLLYGISLWLQGRLIRFSAYQVGAVCCWVAGAVAFLLDTTDQLLVLAAAVVLGYIIPGHMLAAKTRRENVR